MIRADWTPLWAADASNVKTLGPKQVTCLELLRDRGPLTRKEARAGGIGMSTLDRLCMAFDCYPPLVDFTSEHPQRFYLAAPSQQGDLDRTLTILAQHPGGIQWWQLVQLQKQQGCSWLDPVVWHIYGAGLARYQTGQILYPAAPGEQQQLMQPHARKTARAMAVDPLAVTA